VALGTMDQLRTEADEPGSSLEQIFLRLTEEAHVGQAPGQDDAP
jgi:hypothetical protein